MKKENSQKSNPGLVNNSNRVWKMGVRYSADVLQRK